MSNRTPLSKRKNSNASNSNEHQNIGIRLNSNTSVHSQVHRLPHNHHNHHRPSSSLCNNQTKFITVVAIYLVGSFIIVLYHLTGLSAALTQERLGHFRYHPEWHPTKRRERFPSVDERVKYYMSSWYLPPCSSSTEHAAAAAADTTNNNNKLQYTLFMTNQTLVTAKVVSSSDVMMSNSNSNNNKGVFDFYAVIRQDTLLYLNEAIIHDCVRGGMTLMRDRFFGRLSSSFVERRAYYRPVCFDLSDLVHSVQPSLVLLGGGTTHVEEAASAVIPMFVPWRKIVQDDHDSSLTTVSTTCRQASLSSFRSNGPILWRMQSQRQYNLLARANRADTKWEKKTNKAIWSPSFSGAPGVDDFKVVPETKEQCLQDLVCQFVWKHATSELITAGYRQRRLLEESTSTTTTIDGVSMTRTPASLRQMQSFKVLIHFESPTGENYGVGLAWKLYSQSVLLMYPPTTTTWLMEDYLKPWVHYIPLNGTNNAESMVWWVMNNDEAAQKISERASMFVHDLLLHKDAMTDEDQINQEIMKRYQAHWKTDDNRS